MNFYDFKKLKDFVKKSYGIDPDEVKSDFQSIKVELDLDGVERRVHETADGLEYEDDKGNRHKGFLFIEKGLNRRVARDNNWGTIVPKFHIYNCATITQQKNRDNFDGHYVFSQKPEQMKDLDGLMKYLPLCKNCLKRSRDINSVIDTKEYYEDHIKKSDGKEGFTVLEQPKQFSVDAWGYTQDWAKESSNYRAKNNYICEDCGIQLNKSMSDSYYLDTHHISGNKTNNKESNLKCLCVKCHSQVDDVHRRNFSKGHNKQRILDFEELFGV